MNRRRTRLALASLALACCLMTPAAGAWAGVGGGTQRWTATYDAGTPAFSYDVAVSPDGSTVFSTGTTSYGTTAPGQMATVAVDAQTGETKWSRVYQSTGVAGQSDRGTRIAVSADGSRVFVTGESSCPYGCGSGAFSGYSTVAYDAATGHRLWAAQFADDGPGAYSIAVSPDGSTVFVNGEAATWPGNETIAYDAATGSHLYAIPSSDYMAPWNALAVSNDSSTVFVATVGSSQCGLRISTYNVSDGTPGWSAGYPECIPADAHLAITLSRDGSTLYAVGGARGEFATVAFDASTGTQLWAAVDNQVAVDGDIQPSIAASPDGREVFVVGNPVCTPSCSDEPLITIGYEAANGDQLWKSQYDSGGRTSPVDLAVSADSSLVYVAAQEQTSMHVNAPLIAYDAATGAEAWVDDYQDNSAFALAASPTGANVYIGGTFTTLTSATSSGHLRPMARSGCSVSACGYSVTAYNGHAGAGVSQDRDPSPGFDGWRTIFDRTALGGAYRASRTAGDAATYTTPRTRKVVWITHVGRQGGRARLLIDGRSHGTFDLYAAAGAVRRLRFPNLPLKKHVVTIEVLGTKDAASSGRWVAVDAFVERDNLHQETAPGVMYGTWRGVVARAASAGTYRVSKFPRGRLTLAFTGHRLEWITATGPAYGRARLVIDGVGHTVDLYRARHHWRVGISFTGLGAGTHHVTLIPLGTKDRASASANVVFDAFVVR